MLDAPVTGSKVLKRTLARNARRLTAGTALISAHQICEATVPILIGVIVDRAVAPGDGRALVGWLVALALLFTTLTLVYRFGARTLMRAIAHEAHLLRLELARKIMHPRGIDTDLRAGDLLTVSSSDADNTSHLLDSVPRGVGAIVATAVCSAALLFIDVPLGLAVLVATPLVLAALHLATPRITRRIAEQQERAGEAASLATYLVSGVRPLRGIGAARAASERYREVSRASLAAHLRAARTQAVYLGVSSASGALLACGVAVFAGWAALTGRITVGEFLTVIGLAQFLMEPVGLLAEIPGWIAGARASADRVAKVVGAPLLLPDDTDAATLPEGPAGLEVRELSYGSLQGVTLAARPGEFVGIVAHRACDADALIGVLSGRVSPGDHTGRVLLAGLPLTGIRLEDARRVLLVEPHRTDLFEGTLAANLSPDGPPDLALLAEALTAAAADEVVAAHPTGLDHTIVERGASLSGGQRQRTALSRALLARPPILVLHDPTTAVDAVTEHTIARGIRSLRHPPNGPAHHTTLIITSSPALLSVTDRVLIIADGQLIADATHTTLAATNPDYRQAVLR
ncbi:ABC transporter ATP-binding protein [Actinocorallia lasiicapitis]